MDEYISREAILDDLEKEIEAGNIALDEDVWINKGLRIAIRDIKDIKTADVQPIRHGRWIYKGTVNGWDEMACSCCDGAFSTQDREQILDWEFCPHCGARMDGDCN
jgi:hypothetical protein